MIKIEEQLPKMVDISAEFSKMKDGKSTSLYHAMDESMLNKLIDKSKKVFTAEEGWSYVTSSEKDLAVFFRGDEQFTVGHDIGTHKSFDACVYEGTKKKVERLIKNIASISGISLEGQVKISEPYIMIPERVVSQAVNSPGNNIDEVVLDSLKTLNKPVYPYVINASIEREIKNNVKVGELERALYGYADIQHAVDGSLRKLYKENKIYLENNLVCLMDKSKFKDNEFNVVFNFRDASCDDTVLYRDIDTQKNTINSCEIWTIKDREGKDIVNLYLKNRNFGNQPSLLKEEILAFVEENRDMFLQQKEKATVWKSRMLQQAFLDRFERLDTSRVEPIEPEKAYEIGKARSMDSKIHDEFTTIVQVEEKIAKGEYTLPKEVVDKLESRALGRRGRSPMSSAEEAGVIIDDFIGDKVREGQNLGQALITLREEEVLDDWFKDAKESIHIGTFRNAMRYSDNGNLVTLDPLVPDGAVRVASALDEIAIPTKNGAILQVDVTEQVGKEAYVLFHVKDEALAKTKNMKEFNTLIEKYSDNVKQSYIFSDFVPQQYWFSKEQRDAFLEQEKGQFVDKPFGNRFEEVVLQKKKEKSQNITMFFKPKTFLDGRADNHPCFMFTGEDNGGKFSVPIPLNRDDITVKILSNSKEFKDWLVVTAKPDATFEKSYGKKFEMINTRSLCALSKEENRKFDRKGTKKVMNQKSYDDYIQAEAAFDSMWGDQR